ncbi:MAG: hypothetical protein KA715_00425 [Xanthomonadaceae bacterium]|nr:hypothetical protein [Xanthomonadaceae bacterium]
MVSGLAVNQNFNDQGNESDSQSKLKTEMFSFLDEKMSSIPLVNQNVNSLTVGIEHEFFLVNIENKPVSPETSQEFLKYISTLKGWSSAESFSFNDMTKLTWRISHKKENEKMTSLRYKHHPHHFELVTSNYTDLHELRVKLEKMFELLDSAATKLGLKVFNQPLLGIPSFSKSVTSEIPYYSDMRNFRTKLFLRGNEALDSETINYPAVIASSKTVIGGINWFKQPEIIQRLYLIEPKIQSLILPRKNLWNAGDLQEVLRKRWNGMLAPHKFSPLAGFPRISEWNLDEWFAAVMRMPLPGPTDKKWTGRTLNELKESPFGSPGTLFNSLSEFQMISPNYKGTVKFSLDPTQMDIKYLMNLVAFRMGLTAVASLGFSPKTTLTQAEAEWKRRISGEEELKSKEAAAYFAAADKGLRLRKQAEEKYLVLM